MAEYIRDIASTRWRREIAREYRWPPYLHSKSFTKRIWIALPSRSRFFI